MTKALSARQIVLVVNRTMKTSLMYFLTVLLLSRCGIRLVLIRGYVQHALSSTFSATDAIFSLLECLSGELAQRLATMLQSIWKHRNLKVWSVLGIWSLIGSWLISPRLLHLQITSRRRLMGRARGQGGFFFASTSC